MNPARLRCWLLLPAVLALAGSGLEPAEPDEVVDRQPVLVFGMAPVVGVEATVKRFTPLTEHMSQRLGQPVRLDVTASYGELIAKIERGDVDLAKISPLAYVRARRRIPALRLIATHVASGSVTYSSYIVGLQDNPHASLDKLKGARVCFADPDSTSGYLYPVSYLRSRRIQPGRDIRATFGGSHRACLEALLGGRCDLAATWAGAIRDARQGGLDIGELTIVAKTGRIPYDAYCVRPGLDEQDAVRIRDVLLDTNTLSREGRRVLAPTLGINGWVCGDDHGSEGIRKVERELPDNSALRWRQPAKELP